jgi:hypothetical protein
MTGYVCTDQGQHAPATLGQWNEVLAAVEVPVARDRQRRGEPPIEVNWVPGRLPKPHRARGDSANILYRDGTVRITWICPRCKREKLCSLDTLTAALVFDEVDISI